MTIPTVEINKRNDKTIWLNFFCTLILRDALNIKKNYQNNSIKFWKFCIRILFLSGLTMFIVLIMSALTAILQFD